MGRKKYYTGSVERAMLRRLDELAEFDEFTTEILPLLRKALSEGLTADELENHPKIKAALSARQLTIALKGKSGEAMAAIKDIRDRREGKAVERLQIKQTLEQAPDDVLDAKLKSLLDKTSSDEESKH